MTIEIAVGQGACVLQFGEAHAVRICNQARANGKPSAFVKDALETRVRERCVAAVHAAFSTASREPRTPITICPSPNVAGITHHASALFPGANNSAAPLAANSAAIQPMPGGAIARDAISPSA